MSRTVLNVKKEKRKNSLEIMPADMNVQPKTAKPIIGGLTESQPSKILDMFGKDLEIL